jgi:hypothetical protein
MSLIFEALQRLEGKRPETNPPPTPEAVEYLELALRRAAPESETALKVPGDESPRPPAPVEPLPLAAGSTFPAGASSPAAVPGPLGDPPQPLFPPHPGPSLVSPALPSPAQAPPFKLPTGIQRAVAMLRVALPFVQNILPLLDKNSNTDNSNSLALQQQAPPAAPLPPKVDLAPIQNSLAELKTRHHELRELVLQQNTSFKSIEDRLEMVREATNRNTLEQQELIEDLKGVRRKINFAALIALTLLAGSIGATLVLYLHILKVLP